MYKKDTLKRESERLCAKMLSQIVIGVGGGGRLQVVFSFLLMHVNCFQLCITFIARQNSKQF